MDDSTKLRKICSRVQSISANSGASFYGAKDLFRNTRYYKKIHNHLDKLPDQQETIYEIYNNLLNRVNLTLLSLMKEYTLEQLGVVRTATGVKVIHIKTGNVLSELSFDNITNIESL